MTAFIVRTCARIVFLITAALLISLAVKNRQNVSFYYNPLRVTEDGPAIDVPLFILLVATLLAGILLGVIISSANRLVHRWLHPTADRPGRHAGLPDTSLTPGAVNPDFTDLSSDLPDTHSVLEKGR